MRARRSDPPPYDGAGGGRAAPHGMEHEKTRASASGLVYIGCAGWAGGR